MRDANDGLSNEEIEKRDRMIAEALFESRAFDEKYKIGLLCIHLEPGTPEGLNGHRENRPIYGLNWLSESLKYNKQLILKITSAKILATLSSIAVNDPCLRGSSWAIAVKLSARFFFNYKMGGYRFQSDDYDFSFDCPLTVLNIDFDDIANFVADIYEQKHMRYRLWDEESVNLLSWFLLRGNNAFHFFEEAPLNNYLDEGRPLTLDRIIGYIDEILSDIHTIGFTEVEFPDLGDCAYRGNPSCIFSEYTPIQNMDKELLDWLYNEYLETCILLPSEPKD